jgi:hypothetical protein
MRNSRHILFRLPFAFLLAVSFGTIAHSQETGTAPNSAQPSRDSSTVADAPKVPETAQPAGDPAAATGESQPAAAATLSSPHSAQSSAATLTPDETSDNQWHVYGTAYLWIPTMHGTVGVRGYDTNIHVSTGEIFSNFRGGILGVFTPTYNRFSAPLDVLWMRLRPSKQVPYVPVDGSSSDYYVRALLNESIITPKAAYLALDNPKIKIYGTAGSRVWHIGTTLSLYPSIGGPNPYKGITWTDFVMGARFNVPLGTKASVDILGDGGEGGATLDYQVGGIVNYKIKPKMTAQLGWRYLTEHYGNDGNIQNTTTQGVVFGATYQFK